MKKLFLLLAFLSVAPTFAQIVEPVKWKSRVEKISDTEFNLVFEAKIDDEWHIYSQFTPDGGPLPLTLTFNDTKGNYEPLGKATESATKRQYNDVFEVDEVFFSNSAVIKQKIKTLHNKAQVVNITLDYQVCKEVCINEREKFSFRIPAGGATETNQIPVARTDSLKTVKETPMSAPVGSRMINKVVVQAAGGEEDHSVWAIFLGTILAGLLATITPCVFPMIPMTVSFFLKQSANRTRGKFNAFFYGFCIVAICVLISLPFHLIEGLNPDIFADISTNVTLNIFFFLVFAVFAISFFGAFEITLPSRFANKVDNASNSGGLAGIFFMALTLIIVSFSCIGPALGFVLGTALNSDGGAFILSIAMLGFGIGLALPFMFFAFAPRLLGTLPKSGGWLNTVKVVFGFIELALAFKFLSNADLVLQLHLLEREVFLSIWIAIFGTLALYLFGKITLPHDSPLPSISVGRLSFALLVLSFTIYLIPGLWGAPLKLISAFPPPQNYSESPIGFGGTLAAAPLNGFPEGAVSGPHQIPSFEDYDKGMAYAKKVGKPVLIDFTGRACQNCRLMENNVWSDEKVLNILREDVVLISLFGDERVELPAEKQYISKYSGDKIETIGQKWSEFQREKFGSNARPFYVLQSPEGTLLNKPVGYTPDIEEYYNWLKSGIKITASPSKQ
ncbi:MAG TPA: thioredoxin family protein [Flavobacterium sp.]|jgi:thiol:disulfide interchange protein DsbD